MSGPAPETHQEQPCRVCGEPTLNIREDGPLCRDCGIEEAIDASRCEECKEPIWNKHAMALRMQPFGHLSSCVRGREERAIGEALVEGAIYATSHKPLCPEESALVKHLMNRVADLRHELAAANAEVARLRAELETEKALHRQALESGGL